MPTDWTSKRPTDGRVLDDGETITLKLDMGVDWPIVCCDCGLVHIFALSLDGDSLSVKITRRHKATEMVRSGGNGVVNNQEWVEALDAD